MSSPRHAFGSDLQVLADTWLRGHATLKYYELLSAARPLRGQFGEHSDLDEQAEFLLQTSRHAASTLQASEKASGSRCKLLRQE